MSQATFDPTKYNKSDNTPFSEVLEKELSRRSVLRGGAGIAAMSLFAGAGLVGCSDDDDDAAAEVASAVDQLNFNSILGSKTDSVALAEGYSAKVLAPWGEPLNSTAAAWKADGSNTAEDQANSVGMHHDGMYFFPLNGSDTDGVLCINHEYIDQNALHPNGRTEDINGDRTIAEEIRKEINAHGVTTVRVQLINGSWQIVKDDPLNRRFTGATEMDITGPLAGHASLITKYSQVRSVARGTLNNCGNGFTPWGTYLTCEENWPGYFTKANGRTSADDRIGVGPRAPVMVGKIWRVTPVSRTMNSLASMPRPAAPVRSRIIATKPTVTAILLKSTPTMAAPAPRSAPRWVASAMRAAYTAN